MNIFNHLDYRQVITELVEERREHDRRVSFQALASHIRVPKSYLSRVVHGDADLSHDQLYLACDYFSLTRAERRYLSLLLDHARSGLERRKVEIGKEILSEQRRHLDPGRHLESKQSGIEVPLESEYYLDPLLQIIHAAISIPKYQNDLKALAAELRTATERVVDAVNKLERMGICERTPGGLRVREMSLHLPKDSPITAAWRSQLKFLSLQRMQALPKDASYSFSVVVSGAESLETVIRARFLDFLQGLQKDVEGSPPEKVLQISFDLLPWA